MTHEQIIAELTRIWHSPHLDLILKARLGEAIETLKEKNQSDSLVTDSSDDCKESESKLNLISRQAVLDALEESGYCYHFWIDIENVINSLPSAEPKTGEWIQKDMYADRFCSECDYAVWDSEAEEYNFCPHCGARMEVRKNEKDNRRNAEQH